MVRDPKNNLAIISDTSRTWPAARVWAVFGAIAVAGSAAAIFYAIRGLTLSHYDARAHLVVARRIIDSLTPGWHQVGAVWLPLPHLLNALPVSLDWNYRTGFSGTAISVIAIAAGLTVLARDLHERTGSMAAAVAAPLVILANPSVLYLQSTPMTEPLLFGLSLGAVVAVARYLTAPSRTRRRIVSALLTALVLTRYEGWFIVAALGALLLWQSRERARAAAILVCPVAAIAGFLLLSWASTGEWFVTSGFFVADNPVRHRPFAVVADILKSVRALAGWTVLGAGAAGAVLLALAVRRDPRAAAMVALLAAGALPFAAFFQGHPHRIRYMVPLVVAAGALAAAAVARAPKRFQGLAAAVLVLAAWVERPPFDPQSPMVMEAQWETPLRIGRQAVGRALAEAYDGRPILASMGSLAHFMQEVSTYGFDIADFVHEGNERLWTSSFDAPERHVGWVLVEEQAEGGDVIARRLRADDSYLAEFVRIAAGGGTALYRRIDARTLGSDRSARR